MVPGEDAGLSAAGGADPIAGHLLTPSVCTESVPRSINRFERKKNVGLAIRPGDWTHLRALGKLARTLAELPEQERRTTRASALHFLSRASGAREAWCWRVAMTSGCLRTWSMQKSCRNEWHGDLVSFSRLWPRAWALVTGSDR